ncbi:MAG TPA: hypothetical protein VGL08_16940 [Paraburkholderia sp.]|jgi:hypothetical protein
MNLQEQIGALETSVDHLIQAVATSAVASPPAETEAVIDDHAPSTARNDAPLTQDAAASGEKPSLHIERPSQNEIAMSIGGQTVSLHPVQLGQLIEELSNARASMQPEAPANLPAGWRFVSTKNPAMAVQKQSNGDRLLVMRHTGHGWVPFTFSPDMIVQMYMMLTKG